MTEANKKLVADFIDRVNAVLGGMGGDPYGLLDDDAVLVVNGATPLSGVFRAKKEIHNIFVRTAARRLEKGEVALVDAVAEGDKVGVFLKVTAQTRAGKRFNAGGDPSGCMFTVAAGKIIAIHFFPDTTEIETILYERAFVPNRPSKTGKRGPP
jgi:ketosteroid isomerase-like protein